jgi:hypothetical protein
MAAGFSGDEARMPAPKGNKFAVGNKGGRPSKYRPDYAEQAEQLCRGGAINEGLADFFGVDVVTIHRWSRAHPEFARALSKGKLVVDVRSPKPVGNCPVFAAPGRQVGRGRECSSTEPARFLFIAQHVVELFEWSPHDPLVIEQRLNPLLHRIDATNWCE